MFTDFTTAEALARHRAAELDRRIEMARHQAERLAAASTTGTGRRDGHHLLGGLRPSRTHRPATAQ
jgi:hypothetical protein